MNRQYPYLHNSRGEFWEGGKSFPSGHAAASFAFASVSLGQVGRICVGDRREPGAPRRQEALSFRCSGRSDRWVCNGSLSG
jgi:hypothetical protein